MLILGYGGHGRVVGDAAAECGYDKIGFLDDRADIQGQDEILGPFSCVNDLVGLWSEAIAAVGDGRLRLKLFGDLERAGFSTPNIIHPSAVLSRQARLGRGIFVAAGVVINTGATIGNAAIINTGACIDHDCRIGDGAHIAPGASLSGNVHVGERSWIGTGSSVRQSVTIVDDVVVGVGSAVVSDLTVPGTYIGVPARLMTKPS
ncbi:MAG: acetyltransferase [Rhizobiaceae bacterium]